MVRKKHKLSYSIPRSACAHFILNFANLPQNALASSAENPDAPKASKASFSQGESLEFSGKAVANLAADPDVIAKAGRILLTADLAREYGFVDEDGTITGDMRCLRNALAQRGYTTLAGYVPEWVRIPHRLFYMAGYKF